MAATVFYMAQPNCHCDFLTLACPQIPLLILLLPTSFYLGNARSTPPSPRVHFPSLGGRWAHPAPHLCSRDAVWTRTSCRAVRTTGCSHSLTGVCLPPWAVGPALCGRAAFLLIVFPVTVTKEVLSKYLLSVVLFFLRFFKKDFIYFFRKRKGQEKRRETLMCGCLLYTPYWGPGPQPRHVPWLGIEPATLWFTGLHSIHWATPARC